MEITRLLQRVQNGDKAALDSLIPLVYDELKKLASAHLRRESKTDSLQSTELLHEAFCASPTAAIPLTRIDRISMALRRG